MKSPGANAVAVAEHTIGMVLAMARNLSRADALMHTGKWEKKSLQGTELRGKTLAILGLGRIGMEVARRAPAFGMETLSPHPLVSTASAKKQGTPPAKREERYCAGGHPTPRHGPCTQTH